MADAAKLSDQERDELVAYLDGEIDPAAAEKIRQRLAQDEKARGEAQSLSRAWDMLDFLDMPPARPEFAAQTVRSIAQLPATPAPASLEWTPRTKLMLAAGALVVAFLVGCAAALAIPDPDRALLHEETLWENLDEYQAVGDVDFLRRLADQKVFDRGEITERSGASETPAAASKLSSLSSQELDLLRGRRREFESLPAAEKERIRRIDAVASKGDDSAVLRRTMREYAVWLDSLTLTQRKKIEQATDPQARLAVVEALTAEQKKTLETALRPLRDQNGRSPFAGRGRMLKFWSDQREPIKSLEERLTPLISADERIALEKLGDSRDKYIFLLILAAAHGQPAPESLIQAQGFTISRLYAALEPVHRVLGAPEYESLEPNAKRKFDELLAATFIAAQSTSRETLLTFFDEKKPPQPRGQRVGIQPESTLFYVVPCFYYFLADPRRAPDDYREKYMKYLRPESKGFNSRNRFDAPSPERPFPKKTKNKQDRPSNHG